MFPQLGMMEMVVVMGVAVLLFGKRLPEVGRSLGKGIVEFKKGLRGIEDGFDFSGTADVPARRSNDHEYTGSLAPGEPSDGSVVPKFEPPVAAPVAVPPAAEPVARQPLD